LSGALPAAERDRPILLVEGKRYLGWTSLRVTRALDRAAADFSLDIAESWPGLTESWSLAPFNPVQLLLGDEGDLVLTGYIDRVAPGVDADRATVAVAGRSKTCDLIDCTPEIAGTEFRRSTLPAIARALCAPFGIEVVEEVDTGAAFPVEGFDRGDTAYETIERLARLRAVLATDDPQGRLVLTRATTTRRASTDLVLGQNVEAAEAELNGAKRFSRYLVLAQQPSAVAWDREGDGDAEDEDRTERPGSSPQPAVQATTEDATVPRYRPRIFRAEGAADAASATARAAWAAKTAAARAVRCTVTVQGWRQGDGRLWQVNELVMARIPRLQLDREMLVAALTFHASVEQGRVTELVLTPPEALTPEPISYRHRGGGGAGNDQWSGVRSAR
jgi:prophage tail gpP-like protein